MPPTAALLVAGGPGLLARGDVPYPPYPLATRADDDWGSGEMSYARIVRVLTSLSLSFGLISVLSTLLAFYWFVKMKRSFRHDLIMLLIQSDLIKSLWFVIFPIVNFVNGPVGSDSAFCQVSGFFLTVGIESSDVAVFLIAIHSIMYILRPGSGLYPYRRIAYAAYVLIPSFLASLAFINGHGYQNVGHYCYLRTDYSWARLALSWVPRYVLLVMAVVIYLFLYVYVSRMMGTYGRRASGNFAQGRREDHAKGTPPVPPIAYHGLIPSTPTTHRPSAGDGSGRHPSVSTISTIDLDSVALSGATQVATPPPPTKPAKDINWNWNGLSQPFSLPEAVINGEELEEPVSPANLTAPKLPSAAHCPLSPKSTGFPGAPDDVSEESSRKTALARSFWRRPLASMQQPMSLAEDLATKDTPAPAHKNSQHNIISILRRGPGHRGDTRLSESSTGTALSLSPSIIDDTGAAHNREKMRRQLWSFFLYPLVYIIIWVFPFISHILGYDDAITAEDPQWLLMLSIISLCVQGTVDCVLFTVREKPWKHTKGGFWKGLAKRLSWSWHDMGISGRTREEMLVDGRLARARRNQEIAQEANVRRESQLVPVSTKPGRNWWDVELGNTYDGASGGSARG